MPDECPLCAKSRHSAPRQKSRYSITSFFLDFAIL
jgi:hypothetical protein